MPCKRKIHYTDLQKYVGSVIWFECDGEESKPMRLSRTADGLSLVFNETPRGGIYFTFTKETISKINIYTNAV